MKIRVPTTRLKDIGPLDTVVRLPTASRKRHGMKTICKRCGRPIEDDNFIGGFKAGQPNVMLHESCWDGSGKRFGKEWGG